MPGPQDGARGLVVLVAALFVVPRIMTYMPDFDPLLCIFGLFAVLIALQHVGLIGATEGAASGESPRHRGPSRGNKEEEREESAAEKFDGQLAEAERCIQQNNYGRAQELAQKAADLDPESARAWELLATAQKWAGLRKEALATVKKAKDLYEVESQGLADLLKELGQTKAPGAIAAECEAKGEDFISKRMYDLASPCYTQAIEALEAAEASQADRPLRLRLLRRRAECAQQLQDWGQCRRDATVLLEEDPEDTRALLQRAAANEALEKFKAALDDARKLLAQDPKNSAANRIVHNCQQALRD